jgi:hypothetical protein
VLLSFVVVDDGKQESKQYTAQHTRIREKKINFVEQ